MVLSRRLIRTRLTVICAALACCQSCGPTLSTKSSQVLTMLGGYARLNGSGCPDGNASKAATNIYLDEGRKRKPFSTWLPSVAGQVAAICPAGMLTMTPQNQVDARRVTAVLGASAVLGDGSIQMEPWLRLSVVDGKIANILVDLAKVRDEEP